MEYIPLKKEFFKVGALDLAQSLLGKILVHTTPKGLLAGIIVETEAYLQNDPASHSSIGATNRSKPMFEEGGIAYVYFTYGMHYCFNIVSGKKGTGEAVLIRALEPLKGIDIMKLNRKQTNLSNLTNGPAKLTQAFGINKNHNYLKLYTKPLYITINPKEDKSKEIIQTTRIGIKVGADLPYRFYIKGNKFVSKL